MPVFNRRDSVLDALESIKNQNIKDQIEIIIIDDSNDITSKIIKEYIIKNKHLKIKYFKPKKRAGINKSRNLGIKNAVYDIIVFLDSDDQLLEGALEDISVAFQSNKDIVIYFGRIKKLKDNSRKFILSRNLPTVGDYVDYLKTFRKQGEVLPALRNYAIKSQEKLFDEDLWGFENLLYLRLLKNGGKYFRSKKVVRLYNNINEDRLSASGLSKVQNRRDGYLRQLKENGKSFFFYSPINFLNTLIRIIVYNRLIKRSRKLFFYEILSILTFPLPKFFFRLVIKIFIKMQ
tara:strand:- start:239 stop:1108 length:870 start_codon:yes stop_codon:yes gene_type:complete